MNTAKGTFEVALKPQKDGGFSAGRMLIDKVYSGDIVGSGKGQMISKRTEVGPAVYYAIEEFSGLIEGIQGSFTLLHRGFMNKDTQSLEVSILAGSGSGDLESISGSMTITQDSDGHAFQLEYEL